MPESSTSRLLNTLRNHWPFAAILILVFAIQCDGVNLFSRDLIKYDDHMFVAGFRHLGLSGYFSDWLHRPDTYAFPFRDMLYFLDFAIENATGLRSYLLQNILLFLLYGLFLYRVALRLLSQRWALALSGLVLLNPIHVQVVQWTSARKHIVTGLLAMIMMDIVTSTAKRNENNASHNINWPQLTTLFILQIGITLSYMSGSLAFLVPAAMAAALLPNQGKKWGIFLIANSIVTYQLSKIFVSQNMDFARSTSIFKLDRDDLINLFDAFGRMTWNIIFPSRPSVYYSENSPLNAMGLALLITIIATAVYLWKKAPPQKQKVALPLALAVLVFAIPHATFIVGMREFLASDRYLFLALPYAALFLAVLLERTTQKPERGDLQKFLVATAALACAWFSFVSWRHVSDWRSEKDLFRSCIASENASKCWIMTIENEYDNGGCLAAHVLFSEARKVLTLLPERSNAGAPLKAELPLYEGLCTATLSNVDVAERRKILSNYQKENGQNPGYAFAEILMLLESGSLQEASLLFANATLGDIGQGLSKGHDVRTVQYYFGMAQVMCEKLPLMKNVCDTMLWPVLKENVKPNQTNLKSLITANQLTESALRLSARPPATQAVPAPESLNPNSTPRR